MQNYPFHPLRKHELFPTENEICARMQEIKERGLTHPIVLYENHILVGRTDYLACIRLGVTPRFRVQGQVPNPMAIVRVEKGRRLSQATPVPPDVAPKQTEQDQQAPATPQHAISTLERTDAAQLHDGRENVRRLAGSIGIRGAARQYGLKESRVLNWAWRYRWNIPRRRHILRPQLNRCPSCGQPVIIR